MLVSWSKILECTIYNLARNRSTQSGVVLEMLSTAKLSSRPDWICWPFWIISFWSFQFSIPLGVSRRGFKLLDKLFNSRDHVDKQLRMNLTLQCADCSALHLSLWSAIKLNLKLSFKHEENISILMVSKPNSLTKRVSAEQADSQNGAVQHYGFLVSLNFSTKKLPWCLSCFIGWT